MSKHKAFVNANVSLTPQIFYILLALATKEMHGYDIMKSVERDSNGKVTLGPGTLYGAIKRMLEEKLISSSDTLHTRRKYYRLTDKGRSIFSEELQRYSSVVELAKKRSFLGKPSLAKVIVTYG